MPYVKKTRREMLERGDRARNAGDLNYLFSTISARYLINHGLSYDTINDVMGAHIGSLLEFYRRVAVPYEDTKIAENGDVYGNVMKLLKPEDTSHE